MLLPDQVRPFLASDDVLLRAHATRYFDHASDVGPLTADDLWLAIDKTGVTRSAADLIRLLQQVPQTDASTDRLLAAIQAAPIDRPRDYLLAALDNLDFAQLRRHRERILARDDVPLNTIQHLEERLRLADVPFEELWGDLLRLANPATEDGWDDIDAIHNARVVEAAARHGQLAADRAMALLDEAENPDGYTDVFAVHLLGIQRHRPALDRMLEHFADAPESDEPLHEALIDAIPRVGGHQAIPPIERQFLNWTWDKQVYAAELLARVKHPDAEAALARLLDGAGPRDARDCVAEALLNLCTTQALPALRTIAIVDATYDAERFDLANDFVAAALMADFDFPELALRREEALADAIEEQRQTDDGEYDDEEVDGLRDPFGDDFEDGGHGAFDDLDRLPDDLSFPALPDNLPAAAPTIRNQQPKVGRNDPCPCGSGKKYKKCCLNKS